MALKPDADPFAYQELTSGDLEEAWWSGFYMVEVWSKDGQRPIKLVHASNSLSIAGSIFDAETKRRPRARYKLRQGARVLREWPQETKKAAPE